MKYSYSIPDEFQPFVSYDGSQLLMTWQERDEDGITRVFGRFLDKNGKFIKSTVTEDGGPFRVSTANRGEEGWVSTTPHQKGSSW